MTTRPGTRRAVVPRYTYRIFYRTASGEVIVTAVRHAMREPRQRNAALYGGIR